MSDIIHLNQHFLRDDVIPRRMIELAELERSDMVWEIGPGTGVITRNLVQYSRRVTAIEIDEQFRPALDDLVSSNPNLVVEYGDALERRLPRFNKLIANIPFNITEQLILKLIGHAFDRAVLLVGENYAAHFKGEPNLSTRSAILTAAFFDVTYNGEVGAEYLDPPPAAQCALISLEPKKKKDLPTIALYLARALWERRTKSLSVALQDGIYEYVTAQGGNHESGREKRIYRRLEENGYSLQTRVDTIPGTVFVSLYNDLSRIKKSDMFGGHKPRGGARSWQHTYAAYLPLRHPKDRK